MFKSRFMTILLGVLYALAVSGLGAIAIFAAMAAIAASMGFNTRFF